MRAISFTVVELMSRLKLLIIKVKIGIINIGNSTLYIVKLFVGFDDFPVLADFCRFS